MLWRSEGLRVLRSFIVARQVVDLIHWLVRFDDLTPWRQGNFVEVADQFNDVTHDYPPRQQERPEIRLPRIAIVGTGFVGSTTAYALLLSGMAAEVVLIGRDPRRAEGHVHD
jgi:hypothetical protein